MPASRTSVRWQLGARKQRSRWTESLMDDGEESRWVIAPVHSAAHGIVSAMTVLAQTPLHDWHETHGGRLVDFAGWSMPVQYTSIIEEHTATRTSASLFDVSHMGRFRFDGSGAAAFLDRLLSRRTAGMDSGKIRYSLMTDAQGGILDDVLVYHLRDAQDRPFHLLVVNAGNREKISQWIESHLGGSDNTTFTDLTCQTAMIAAQGPKALEITQPLLDIELSNMGYYTGLTTEVDGCSAIVSRTGYTGEDGCELIVAVDDARRIWEKILQQGSSLGAVAAGLGARDTLRLEAAMPLYGHELSEQIDPYQAGLGFAVNLKNRDFIGREALARIKEKTDLPRRVGIEMAGRRVPRQHFAILTGQQRVGEVTSGTFSPTLQRPIAMGYVQPEFSAIGSELSIDVRGRAEPGRVVELPFYKLADRQ